MTDTIVIQPIVNTVKVVQNVSTVKVSGSGPQGPSGENADQNVFIQDTAPSHIGPYVWFNTSGGNLQILVEDGL